MSERPKRKDFSVLEDMLKQISKLSDRAEDELRSVSNDYPEEVWEHATQEAVRDMEIYCYSTMDGDVRVNIRDFNSEIIKSKDFDIFDLFTKSLCRTPDNETVKVIVDKLERVLDLYKRSKVLQ